MTEPWAVYAAVFVLVAVAFNQFHRGLGGWMLSLRDRRKRFDALAVSPPGRSADELRRRSPRFGEARLLRSFSRLVIQSGTRLSAARLATIVLGSAIAIWMVLPHAGASILSFAACLAMCAAFLILWLRLKRGRRLARFGEQLPDVIDVMVRSLRAGHPLAVSLSLVTRETPAPAGVEFGLVVDEVNYGRSLNEALELLAERVGHPELRYLVASTAIAHQTGGNLGEILARLSRMLRDRLRLSRRVRALSAEGRFSGFALSVLPIALFVLINLVNKSYYADFWVSNAATPTLLISLGLLAVGNIAIYRLVNFRV